MTSGFPYRLSRVGVLMRPDPADPHEAEGVLNPAAAWTPDGRLMLFPRVVGAGNFSRIAVADVVVEHGVPIGVQRRGIALAPDRAWERGSDHGGVEDPRITRLAELGRYVMCYVAYGPLGPRPALATSSDLATWTRLGPVQFRYEDRLDTDLNLFPNKDLAWFPDPVTGPDGSPCFAFLHRPMFELPGQRVELPAGITDPRAAIWLSYVRVADALADPAALLRPFGHRELARAESDWEASRSAAARRRCGSTRAGCCSITASPAPSRTTPSSGSRTSTTPRARCCWTATTRPGCWTAPRSRC